SVEPARLVKRRGDNEVDRSARVVPYAVVVRRGNAELVPAWAEIRIVRLAPIADVLPVAVEALELVAEANPLRHRETAGAVLDLQIGRVLRQLDACADVLMALVAVPDRPDRNRRRQRVAHELRRIDRDHSARRREPDAPIGRFDRGGLRAQLPRGTGNA